MKNVQLGRKVLDHIIAHPEEHKQDIYGLQTLCGTRACIAGHAMLRAGYSLRYLDDDRFLDGWFCRPDGERVRRLECEASDLLGLTDDERYGLDDELGLFSSGLSNSEAVERLRVLVEKSEADLP